MKAMKKPYISPSLTIVEFRTERGFATSGDFPQAGMLLLLFNPNSTPSYETETFSTHNTWTEGSDSFWD